MHCHTAFATNCFSFEKLEDFFINPSPPDCRTPSLIRKSSATVIIPLLLKSTQDLFQVKISPKQRKSTVTENRIIPGRICHRKRTKRSTS